MISACLPRHPAVAYLLLVRSFSVLATTTIQGFPWPLIPGLIGFFIAFVVQFQLKNHVDRDKVLEIENMAELYPNGIPPRKVLTERGQRLYLWFYAGGGLFMGSIILCMIIYSR